MNRTTRCLLFVTGLCVLGAVGGGVGSAGAVPALRLTYTLPAPVSVAQCSVDLGCTGGVTGYTYAGSGSADVCHPTDPCDGAFHLALTATRFSPTDPCRMKEGTGTLDVTWADGTTSMGTYAFKARDSHALSLKGSITGGTNNVFVGADLDGLIATPVDPCVGGVVDPSTITVIPPNPV